MTTRPRIGITRSGSADRISRSYQSYHDRVIEAGGEPVDLYPGCSDDPAALVAGLDALLLSGGPDVLPERYGAARHPETDQGDPPRDDLELGALAAARERALPVLAICRGHQVLNIGFGGGLLQHIEGNTHRALDAEGYPSRWHQVEVAPGTRLAALTRAGWIETNSRHHQAVTDETLAPGLVVTARAADGIIEGLEAPAYPGWLVSVQWHPERDEVKDLFRPLFEAFITAAGRRPAAAVLSAGY
jgi:putative glutamine amidotransferase